VEPEKRVACDSLGCQFRVTPIQVSLKRKIGISELSLFGFIYNPGLATVDANIFKFTLRPTNRCSVQFFKSSLLHSVANDGYPCGVSALMWFRAGFRAVRFIYRKPVTSWNLAIEKTRFWYESSAKSSVVARGKMWAGERVEGRSLVATARRRYDWASVCGDPACVCPPLNTSSDLSSSSASSAPTAICSQNT